MIKQLKHDEIKEIYPYLYKECFGKPAPRAIPPIMLIAEDKNRIFAFSAGYFHNNNTFYINSLGMIPKYRTKKNAVIYEKSFHAFYRRMGVKYLIGFVGNTNIRTLHVALRSGYLITGCRVSSDKKIYVIITKQL